MWWPDTQSILATCLWGHHFGAIAAEWLPCVRPGHIPWRWQSLYPLRAWLLGGGWGACTTNTVTLHCNGVQCLTQSWGKWQTPYKKGHRRWDVKTKERQVQRTLMKTPLRTQAHRCDRNEREKGSQLLQEQQVHIKRQNRFRNVMWSGTTAEMETPPDQKMSSRIFFKVTK